MSKLTIERLDFDNLSQEERLGVSHNGCGAEYASYIKVTHGGKLVSLKSDAMEPEDCRFSRDLSWIIPVIQEVYALGLVDGGESKKS